MKFTMRMYKLYCKNNGLVEDRLKNLEHFIEKEKCLSKNIYSNIKNVEEK